MASLLPTVTKYISASRSETFGQCLRSAKKAGVNCLDLQPATVAEPNWHRSHNMFNKRPFAGLLSWLSTDVSYASFCES